MKKLLKNLRAHHQVKKLLYPPQGEDARNPNKLCFPELCNFVLLLIIMGLANSKQEKNGLNLVIMGPPGFYYSEILNFKDLEKALKHLESRKNTVFVIWPRGTC